LASLLAKKQLKPADLLSSMDTNKNGTVDCDEFARGLRSLGMDGTQEELEGIFKRLDADGSNSIDFDEIKIMVAKVHSVKDKAKLQEKRLMKDLARIEQVAKEVVAQVRAELMEDQRKKEAQAETEKRAMEERRRMNNAAAEEAKAEAKEKWQRAKKLEFEKRIQEKRTKGVGGSAKADMTTTPRTFAL